ncbi:hypothetical protein FA95DRAFT_515181 [Auriscalpium vulgare]|uniref:Uncharacterized protein n=1 Tax=Auriscalpium vulgare TaxID=40419 RepID=A0ACB8RG25_9AGAM|nr:hypothetical protein FA95DRAFT_515181 [Auriscalpium vulgare]
MLRLPRNDQADRRLRPILGTTLEWQIVMKGNPQSQRLLFCRKVLKDLISNGRETNQKLDREAKASAWFAADHDTWLAADFAGAERRRTQDPEVGKCDSLCVVKLGGVIPASLQAEFNEINLVMFPDTHEKATALRSSSSPVASFSVPQKRPHPEL